MLLVVDSWRPDIGGAGDEIQTSCPALIARRCCPPHRPATQRAANERVGWTGAGEPETHHRVVDRARGWRFYPTLAVSQAHISQAGGLEQGQTGEQQAVNNMFQQLLGQMG